MRIAFLSRRAVTQPSTTPRLALCPSARKSCVCWWMVVGGMPISAPPWTSRPPAPDRVWAAAATTAQLIAVLAHDDARTRSDHCAPKAGRQPHTGPAATPLSCPRRIRILHTTCAHMHRYGCCSSMASAHRQGWRADLLWAESERARERGERWTDKTTTTTRMRQQQQQCVAGA